MKMPPKISRALATLAVFSLLTPCLEAGSLRETPAVRAVRRIAPSVVNISSEKTVSTENVLYSNRPGHKVSGMGTGVVVDRRGYIVTNHHVVSGVDWLRVTLSDGGIHEARVVSFDRKKDLAIIKIDVKRPLPEMPLGTSSDLMLAETVFAVGNAYGYKDTVTCGIISALHREVEVNENQTHHNLIQTDASINPGNSGGPLINILGDVVGINVAIRAGAQRIGFAIPIDDARRVIAKLIAVDRLNGTWHGIETQDDKKKGSRPRLLVTGAIANSPAASAGLKTGDVILRSDKHAVIDAVDFERSLLDRKAGSPIMLTINRAGKQMTVKLVLGDSDKIWRAFGMRLQMIKSHELQQRHGNEVLEHYEGGLRVTNIRKDGPAYSNGIRQGDDLVGLHEWAMTNRENVDWVLDHNKLREFSPVKFWVLREGKTLFGHLPVSSDAR